MKQVQHYFRMHRFVYWLALVVISFVVYAGGEALFGPPCWFFVIVMSIAQPTGIVLFSNFNAKTEAITEAAAAQHFAASGTTATTWSVYGKDKFMDRARFRDLLSSSIVIGIAMGLLNYPLTFAFDSLLGHSHRRDVSSAVLTGCWCMVAFFVGNRRFLKKSQST